VDAVVGLRRDLHFAERVFFNAESRHGWGLSLWS
jgi:hypothetical protein